MIESARRAFLVCHNASKSDRGHRQRGATENETKKTERSWPVDRQDRESQAGRETTRHRDEIKNRGPSRVHSAGTCHVKFSGSGRVCVGPVFSGQSTTERTRSPNAQGGRVGTLASRYRSEGRGERNEREEVEEGRRRKNEEKKKKKRGPSWCRYISLTSLVLASFLYNHSRDWRKKKRRDITPIA